MSLKIARFILIGVAVASVVAPAGAAGWVRTYGGPGDEYLNASSPASDGGFLLVGSSMGVSATETEGWAVRVDSEGVILWQRAVTGDKSLQFDAAVENPDGSFVVAGTTDSFGAQFHDFLLAKLSSAGDLLWTKTYGGALDERASGIIRDADGGYLLVGHTESYGAGNPDGWLVKTDADGAVVWQRSYGGAQWDYLYSVAPFGGGYLLAGLTYTWGVYGDLWLLKVNAAGAPEWRKTYGSSLYDGLTSDSLALTPDGGFAIACSTEGFGALYSDYWVLKFSPAGEVEWQERMGGVNYDDALAIRAEADGGLLVGGTSFTFDLGQGDFWLVKLNPQGAVLWQKAYGGSQPEDCRAVFPLAGGAFYSAGSTGSHGGGGTDFMLLKGEDLGVLEGACVAARITGVVPFATNATGTSTGADGQPSTAPAVPVSAAASTTTFEGPLCEPSYTCTLSCGGEALPVAGTAPLEVAFAGSATATHCTGEPAFSWDFFDGGTSTEQNPTHTFALSGDYPWILRVTIEDQSCERTGTVKVCDIACSAVAQPSSGTAPLEVAFTGSHTASPNCPGDGVYRWSFGDGSTAQGRNVSHTYQAAGSYGWTLSVEVSGATTSRTGTVTVAPGCSVTCAASAAPSSGPAPLTVTFQGSATTSACTGAPAFAWNFGDGNSSTEQNPSHTYGSAGPYDWTLTVTADAAHCTQSGTVTATEGCTLECAGSAPGTGRALEPVSFAAVATATQCSGAPAFAWDFGDGSVSAEQNPSHAYATGGTYTWTLNASVDDKTCMKSGEISVSPACVLTCSATADPAAGTAPLTVVFVATTTSSGCQGGPIFAWDFGDGSVSGEANPVHAYSAEGSYAWALTVTAEGKTCSASGTVVVVAPCSLTCSASATPDHGSAPLAVAFGATYEMSHCAGAPSFAWNFGDGGSSADPNPSHTYATQGEYAWTVTVTAEGETCARGGTVTVTPGVPGDCDGDGTVAIGEVQKAVNMFLGLLAPGCGVDCNGDGTVSIGEVQKVINAFLGLPSSC